MYIFWHGVIKQRKVATRAEYQLHPSSQRTDGYVLCFQSVSHKCMHYTRTHTRRGARTDTHSLSHSSAVCAAQSYTGILFTDEEGSCTVRMLHTEISNNLMARRNLSIAFSRMCCCIAGVFGATLFPCVNHLQTCLVLFLCMLAQILRHAK